MAVGVVMPKAGITVEECVITEWLKKKGDHVNVGDVLFTYMLPNRWPHSLPPPGGTCCWCSGRGMWRST